MINQKMSIKKVNSNKTKHVEVNKKLDDLAKQVKATKDYNFFLGKIFFPAVMAYKICLFINQHLVI